MSTGRIEGFNPYEPALDLGACFRISMAAYLPGAAKPQLLPQKDKEIVCCYNGEEDHLNPSSERLRLKFSVYGINLRKIGFMITGGMIFLPGTQGGVYERTEDKIVIFGSGPGFTDFEVWRAETYEPLCWIRFKIPKLTAAYDYSKIGVTVLDNHQDLILGYRVRLVTPGVV